MFSNTLKVQLIYLFIYYLQIMHQVVTNNQNKVTLFYFHNKIKSKLPLMEMIQVINKNQFNRISKILPISNPIQDNI